MKAAERRLKCLTLAEDYIPEYTHLDYICESSLACVACLERIPTYGLGNLQNFMSACTKVTSIIVDSRWRARILVVVIHPESFPVDTLCKLQVTSEVSTAMVALFKEVG